MIVDELRKIPRNAEIEGVNFNLENEDSVGIVSLWLLIFYK